MSAEFLQALTTSTIASTVAILLVRLLSDPLRRTAGARAAYWLWMLVPVTAFAVLAPAPSQIMASAPVALPIQIQPMWSLSISESTPDHALWTNGALAVWIAGFAAMFVAMVERQRRFSRTLGKPARDSHGFYRSDKISAPMLVGVWRSRILVPLDFEGRYTPDEQELVLAHENAHKGRYDVAVNALASFALCVFWFNPLIYRALAWIRCDQELACDALVLSRFGAARRVYADALLKTQLATDSAWRAPIGCQWQSNHPLKERILMLKKPLPGVSRRLAGVCLVFCITVLAGYGAWAGQPAVQNDGPPILVDLKITIANSQSGDVKELATRYVVHSGEEIKGANAEPLDFACTPYLPDERGRTTDWSSIQSRGIPLPPAGHILFMCTLRQDGQAFSSPAVLMADDHWGTIETSEPSGPRIYKLELKASTSAAHIVETSKSQEKG